MNESLWLASKDPVAMLRWITCAGPSGSAEDDLRRWDRCPSGRKLCLFICALCRGVWDRLGDKRSRRAIIAAEGFADGIVSSEDFRRVWGGAGVEESCTYWLQIDEWLGLSRTVDLVDLPRVFEDFGLSVKYQTDLLRDVIGNPWRAVVCKHCYRGAVPTDRGDNTCEVCKGTEESLPIRWLTPTVVSLSRVAYDQCLPSGFLDFGCLALLSDALEDAGCEEEDLLRHLRGWGRCPSCLGLGTRERTVRKILAPIPHNTYKTEVKQMSCGSDGTGGCGGSGWVKTGLHARGCWAIDLILGKS